MIEIKVDSFIDFQKWLLDHISDFGALYRGQREAGWSLLPSLGRHLPKYTALSDPKNSLLQDERYSLQLFERDAAAYTNPRGISAWENIAMAQHHGLSTRLLDWTHNPLAALFFAVCEESTVDGAVFALPGNAIDDLIDTDPYEDDPLDLSRNVMYVAPRIAPRIAAQESVFIAFKDPVVPLDYDWLIKLVIPGHKKPEIRFELHKFGVSRRLLFPGLDGVAAAINYLKFRGNA